MNLHQTLVHTRIAWHKWRIRRLQCEIIGSLYDIQDTYEIILTEYPCLENLLASFNEKTRELGGEIIAENIKLITYHNLSLRQRDQKIQREIENLKFYVHKLQIA